MTSKYTTTDGGYTFAREDSGILSADSHTTLGTDFTLTPTALDAVSEYVLHQHGIWVDPETGALVARTKASDDNDGRAAMTHLDSKAVTVWEYLASRDSTRQGIKERYFAAHPELKPKWHDAKIGEAWLLTIRGEQSVFVVDKLGDFVGTVASEGHRSERVPRGHDKITAGERLWPVGGGE